LPAPQADLLDKAEQLANFIRRQARPDGSLRCGDADGPDDPACAAEYPGLALYALARSQALRPAPWKLDVLRKAVAHYRSAWQEHKNRALAVAQTPAYAEAYLVTKDKAFADCVLEMNDWLCGLQYQPDPRHPLWTGGFMNWADGKAVESAPQIDSAACAESLAHAARVARDLADVRCHQRYTDGLEQALQFVTTLQYTEGNTQHYADWYRPRVSGAFFASPQDGNLRIDYTQQAISALAVYVEQALR
jgi:hypothetical protein